jgi:hypothetical protein
MGAGGLDGTRRDDGWSSPSALVGGVLAALVPAPSAVGSTSLTQIPVTTTADVVDAGDGQTSLREAISEADALPAEPGDRVEIALVPEGTYRLTRCDAAAEDANSTGDLDVTAPREVELLGLGRTIEQTCAGERVLHNRSDAGLRVIDAVLEGGNGAGGIAVRNEGDLLLGGVTVDGATRRTGPLAADAAVLDAGTGSLVIGESAVRHTTDGAGVSKAAGGSSFTILQSEITDNRTTAGDAAGIVARTPLTITDSLVARNNGTTLPGLPQPGEPVPEPVSGISAGGIDGVVHGERVVIEANLALRVGGLWGGGSRTRGQRRARQLRRRGRRSRRLVPPDPRLARREPRSVHRWVRRNRHDRGLDDRRQRGGRGGRRTRRPRPRHRAAIDGQRQRRGSRRRVDGERRHADARVAHPRGVHRRRKCPERPRRGGDGPRAGALGGRIGAGLRHAAGVDHRRSRRRGGRL